MLGQEQANQKKLVYFPLAEAAHLPVYDRSSGHLSIRSELMTKRAVRIVKHVGSVPCVAACTACGARSSRPLSTLRRVTDAQANLQQQFDRHKCQNEDARKD